MPGYKGLSEGKMLKESINDSFLEELSNSSNSDLAQWAKSTLEAYNKLMDKYYYGPIDRRLGFKNFSMGLSEGKMLKESVNDSFLEDLSRSSNNDLAQWAKITLDEYNKLMDKYYHGPIDKRLGFKSFSERLNKCFGFWDEPDWMSQSLISYAPHYKYRTLNDKCFGEHSVTTLRDLMKPSYAPSGKKDGKIIDYADGVFTFRNWVVSKDLTTEVKFEEGKIYLVRDRGLFDCDRYLGIPKYGKEPEMADRMTKGEFDHELNYKTFELIK